MTTLKLFFVFCILMNIFTQSAAHQQAYWIAPDTVVLPFIDKVQLKTDTKSFLFHNKTPIELTFLKEVDANSLGQKYPYLQGYLAFSIAVSAKEIAAIIKQKIYVYIENKKENFTYTTGIQIYALLDSLFSYQGNDLGVSFDVNKIPHLKLWAPTAKTVQLHLFDDVASKAKIYPMHAKSKGVWHTAGEVSWKNKFYLYEVEVFVPSTNRMERNIVTDPYSISLSTNSRHSQIVDLKDPDLKPKGWDLLSKPKLAGFEDIILYELHLRDFSINDATVSKEFRGTFMAFIEETSDGVKHLKSLAKSGLTHIHLLPVFDIATIEEELYLRQNPKIPGNLPANSPLPQEIIGKIKDQDGFNWGYDPFHYGVPEGSYATNPQGHARVLEMRKMVQALNKMGLRTVMDVVYNHTHQSGQNPKSVLDKIVPGYYYRLDKNGGIQNSSCCADTASEHAMMEKLMLDTLLIWAKHYKIDGFRFDLMGHHTRENMRNVRKMLDSLTIERDGVDGKKIYVYGEGWRFGSLNDILPDQAFHQQNSYGEGIGTFNDRVRDCVRGGNYEHRTKSDQGFITGLHYDYNYCPDNAETSTNLEQQKKVLFNYTDNIRLALAGNLKEYEFVDMDGKKIKGQQVVYRGSKGSGYTAHPHECINYISCHDNYSLWDQICAKAPFNAKKREPTTATALEKARMQNLGLSLVALAQGIPLFHAGSELLRSKSGDGDSYNSGDWFNRLDFSYKSNNWAAGLPSEEKNKHEWSFWSERLIAPQLKPDTKEILFTLAHFHRLLKIRQSSKLFRLPNAEEIKARVKFLPTQTPGLIALSISNQFSNRDLDSNYKQIVVVFNATRKLLQYSAKEWQKINLQLHPVLKETIEIRGQKIAPDPHVLKSTFTNGKIKIAPQTTLVYYQ